VGPPGVFPGPAGGGGKGGGPDFPGGRFLFRGFFDPHGGGGGTWEGPLNFTFTGGTGGDKGSWGGGGARG